MSTAVSRLILSRSSLYRFYTTTLSQSRRLFSTESNKVNEPFKVEEAETKQTMPPLPEKLLVIGGNGFVGSHVCREALERGLSVSSLSRSGRSNIRESWADRIEWQQGSLLVPDSLNVFMDGVTSVISCVGGFGSNSHMYKINGTANINAIRAAAEAGVILRPGFIHGTRQVGSMKLPLGVIGSPLEMILKHAKPLSGIPLVGPLLTPPVSASAVAKVAVRAATDLVFPPGIVDVHGILRFSEQPKRAS